MADPEPSHPLSPAAEAFAEFLARQDDGEEIDFEAFCAERPQIAPKLRRLHSNWVAVAWPVGPEEDRPLSERLSDQLGATLDPQVTLHPDPGDSGSSSSESSTWIDQLTSHRSREPRYRVSEEIARGGMGAVFKVWDTDLRRWLAMKVALGRPVEKGSGSDDDQRLVRFLEEAQITGQLDHPGILPVHELGLDRKGRLYFTMRLVHGRELKDVIAAVRKGDDEWTLTRALGVLLKVCETMGYAHRRGVVHRDLKPSNIMVGRYGEAYVMDWGLARVEGREARRDIRLRIGRTPSVITVETVRRDLADRTPDSPLVTMDGDVVGTPAYMPPEQAKGKVEEVGARSDVYAVGAILYHLIAGRMPFVTKSIRKRGRAVLMRVLEGPPTPLREHVPDVPVELEAICEKAMAREPADRYADMLAMADDLRAYLEGRVVRAYEVGAFAELRKWVGRNRAVSFASAAAVLALVAGLVVSAVGTRRAQASERDAIAAQEKADENALLAEERAREVLQLSDARRLETLVGEARRLWPPHPHRIDDYDGWLQRVDELEARLVGHSSRLDGLRAGAAADEEGEPRFASEEEAWEFESLEELVGRLDELLASPDGLREDVRRRLSFARTIGERSVDGPIAEAKWAEAIASIADPAECPAYGGLEITPQVGLIPIGRDPSSGFWEFAHFQSGVPPVRHPETGEIDLGESSALVLVLIPGGRFRMGAQSDDPFAEGYDPMAADPEAPPHEVELDPFFLSKFEMTQGQWLHVTGEEPSSFGPGFYSGEGKVHDREHPVEQVSWLECTEVMKRLGLRLPTEAQWEYAARAGTETPWSTGLEKESLIGSVNLADQTALRTGHDWGDIHDFPALDDGYSATAPVGTYDPNPFGLHDVHGNVWEWCADSPPDAYLDPPREGDGLRASAPHGQRAFRGGSFFFMARLARSSHRFHRPPDQPSNDIGLRPARPLDAE